MKTPAEVLKDLEDVDGEGTRHPLMQKVMDRMREAATQALHDEGLRPGDVPKGMPGIRQRFLAHKGGRSIEMLMYECGLLKVIDPMDTEDASHVVRAALEDHSDESFRAAPSLEADSWGEVIWKRVEDLTPADRRFAIQFYEHEAEVRRLSARASPEVLGALRALRDLD